MEPWNWNWNRSTDGRHAQHCWGRNVIGRDLEQVSVEGNLEIQIQRHRILTRKAYDEAQKSGSMVYGLWKKVANKKWRKVWLCQRGPGGLA